MEASRAFQSTTKIAWRNILVSAAKLSEAVPGMFPKGVLGCTLARVIADSCGDDGSQNRVGFITSGRFTPRHSGRSNNGSYELPQTLKIILQCYGWTLVVVIPSNCRFQRIYVRRGRKLTAYANDVEISASRDYSSRFLNRF